MKAFFITGEDCHGHAVYSHSIRALGLGLLGVAFGIMFRSFRGARLLRFSNLCMICLPVVWQLYCGVIGDVFRILSAIFQSALLIATQT